MLNKKEMLLVQIDSETKQTVQSILSKYGYTSSSYLHEIMNFIVRNKELPWRSSSSDNKKINRESSWICLGK